MASDHPSIVVLAQDGAVGEAIGGRYRLESVLGQGGMGVVYVARDLTTDAEVALKLLRPSVAQDKRAIGRFLREGEAARRVRHPAVVGILDIGDDERRGHFVTMEYCRGGSLAQLLRRRGHLHEGELLRIGVRLADGMAAMHDVGVVHRDIKPSNILFDEPGGDPRIVDFGMAGLVGPDVAQLTALGDVFGTPTYMSPEQTRGRTLQASTDIYSLGMVLYELVAGTLPFHADNGLAMMDHHRHTTPKPPSACRPVSRFVDLIILQCLEKSPDRRPPSMAALRGQLERMVVDETWGVGSSLQLGVSSEMGVATNITSSRTSFLGRDDELVRLHSLVRRPGSLVTVTGVGGVGKTTFVRHYGLRHVEDFPGGAWFCDLSDASDAGGVCHGVAETIDARLPAQGDVDALGEALAAHGHMLLILDNFEQVADAAAATVGRWREIASDCSFLVTTRRRLHLPGEQLLPLPPLDEGQAVQLFVERASSVKPDFDLDDSTRAIIVDIVRSLDGLALAIELAAARMNMMSTDSIRSRLAERFSLLRDRSRTDDRQATMRGAIDWSWQLLTPAERCAMAQAAVFHGGFDLEAFEAVCDAGEVGGGVPGDILEDLIDRSLVERAGGDRFLLLESIRAYAAEQECPPGAPVRHRRHFAALALARGVAEVSPRHFVEFAKACKDDEDNLRVALDDALEAGDEEAIEPLFHAVTALLKQWGPLSPILGYAERVGELGWEGERGVRIDLTWAEVASELGDVESGLPRAERAGEAALKAGLPVLAGRARLVQSDMRRRGDHFGESIALLYEAISLFTSVSEAREGAYALYRLGALVHDGGRTDLARAYYERGLDLARQVGDLVGEGRLIVSLGGLAIVGGDRPLGREYYERALQLFRKARAGWEQAMAHCNLGDVLYKDGDLEAARFHLEHSRALAERMGSKVLAIVLCTLSEVYARLQDSRAVETSQLGERLGRQMWGIEYLAFLLVHCAQTHRLTGSPASARALAVEAAAMQASLPARLADELGVELDALWAELPEASQDPFSGR